MSATIFFWVLPAVYLCFAILFFWANRLTRDLPSARWAAIGFATAVIAIPVDHLRTAPLSMGFLAAIPLHWLIVTAIMNAFLSRHGDTLPRALCLRIFAVGLVVTALSTWVFIAPLVRMMTVNIIAMALIHAGMLRLWRHRDHVLDRAVAWCVALCWLTYVGRLFMLSVPAVDQDFLVSPIWSQYMLVFYAVSGITALLIGLLIAIAITIDVMAKSARESLTDPLTGVANRRHFERLADDPIAAARVAGVLMIDLDNFKAINTQHGHAGGDAVLNLAAQRIASALPISASLIRMGGEEFSVLLPSHSAAEEIAQNIVDLMAREPMIVDGASIRITTSVGCAKRDSAENLTEALRRADRALYAAKIAGRNRMMLAEEPPKPLAIAA